MRSNFRKGNYHGFDTSTVCRQYAKHRQNKFFTPSTCINSLHTFLSSTQILRSAMMFLSTCFQSLSRDCVRHVFFGDGREHTQKKVSFSFSFLKYRVVIWTATATFATIFRYDPKSIVSLCAPVFENLRNDWIQIATSQRTKRQIELLH